MPLVKSTRFSDRAGRADGNTHPSCPVEVQLWTKECPVIVTLNLNPELEAGLTAQAQASGMTRGGISPGCSGRCCASNAAKGTFG